MIPLAECSTCTRAGVWLMMATLRAVTCKASERVSDKP